MSTWVEVRMKDVAQPKGLVGGPFGSKLVSRDYVESGIPVIRGQNLGSGRWVSLSNSVYVTKEKRERDLGGNRAEAGDLVFTQRGTLGQVAIMPPDAPECVISQSQMRLRVDPSKADPVYVYYWCTSARFRQAISDHAIVAGVPHINLGILSALPLSLPPRRTQQAIVGALGTIDDLIENNRRRVEVLEEMARAIYREWFVKFRYPGHGDVPLVGSALGLIPENWGAGKIGELCSRVQAGSTPRRSTPEYWDEPAADWYKTGDLTDGVLLGSSEKLSDAGLAAGRTFEPETILMAIYGSPTVGRLGLLTSGASANQAALGLVADPDVCTTEYLWFALESLRGHLNQIAQGAAQQNVSKEKVIGCDVLMPPREVIEDFTLRAAPSWRLSHELARQTAVLESLRDLLLPKLVTGQIDVSTLDLDALLVEQVA